MDKFHFNYFQCVKASRILSINCIFYQDLLEKLKSGLCNILAPSSLLRPVCGCESCFLDGWRPTICWLIETGNSFPLKLKSAKKGFDYLIRITRLIFIHCSSSHILLFTTICTNCSTSYQLSSLTKLGSLFSEVLNTAS